MRYYYEYKYKNGSYVAGHNLEYIEFYDECVWLLGVEIVHTMDDYEERFWGTTLDVSEIEYLKIEPMLEKEE